MKTSIFDKDFDSGKDLASALDMSKATRPNRKVRRVNVDFPAWMVERLDHEATRLGINRQAVIKTWIAARLD